MSSKIISHKIEELFHFRQIDYLLELSAIKEKKEYLQWLSELQLSIYELDHYLETVWEVKEHELLMFWKTIYTKLEAFQIPNSKMEEYTKQIYRYQVNELSTRAGKSPTRYSLRYFYFYKTCDVRLMRNLIYKADPSLKRIFVSTAWNYFDLATEVNDDITDFEEDKGTFNVNRFRFQVLEQGVDKTKLDYGCFLKDTDTKARLTLGKENGLYSRLLQSTIKEINRSKALLHKFQLKN